MSALMSQQVSESSNKVVFAPADFPANCQLLPLSGHGAEATRKLLAITRPDIRFVDSFDGAASGNWLLASGPTFWSDIREARARGLSQPVILFPELSTSYYDFWSFPTPLLFRRDDGRLQVHIDDFVQFVTELGDFFGRTINGRHEPEMCRYIPLLRAASGGPGRMNQILSLLEDEQSRSDFRAAAAAEPQELWRHWLRGLYNGLEYMDYLTLVPESVVLNCGVHGGGEIPNFLACMNGRGTIVNVDPLGHAYLAEHVRATLRDSSAVSHEICAALHDTPGRIEMLVEPGGMAQDVRHAQPDHEIRSFRAATVDELVDELALQRLDLIKMDIEGAEPQALSGAWKSIERHRPQLAISIYHHPDHFFELPVAMVGRLKSYRFFIRNYHFISNETIFYAIPRERPYRRRSNTIEVSLI
jgi:FkbM family methyltransferase